MVCEDKGTDHALDLIEEILDYLSTIQNLFESLKEELNVKREESI